MILDKRMDERILCLQNIMHKIIVFLLLITLTSFPVFGQENSGTAGEKESAPIFSVNAQFSYYPSFIQVDGVIETNPVYPLGFSPAPGYSIQLGMGLKLFSTVNAFLDFGLDDPYMSKAMKLAGKIGTKYFDVMYIYKSSSFPQKTISAVDVLPGNEYDQWRFPQNGEKQAAKLNVGTLALMSPLLLDVFKIGFIWNSISANVGLQSENEISGRYVAYLDSDRNFNTYGLRLSVDLTDVYHILYLSGNEGLGKMKLIGKNYIDMTWGDITLSNEAANAVGFSENKKPVSYTVVRGNFGIGWEKGIGAKRSITYGFGLDFFSTIIKFSGSEYDLVNDPAVFGIFALVGMVF
jgi:hypothetical protein